MLPRMSDGEAALFLSFVKNSRDYIEFGTGGSTYIASNNVRNSILSIDSSQEWLDQVSEACTRSQTRPELKFIDIGPTKQWGFPNDHSRKSNWSDYHTTIWNDPRSSEADLYLVDGRFRVACFAQIVLHCKPSAVIGIHDFGSRPAYHRVREIAREIATVEDMSFFLPLPKGKAATELLQDFYHEPF
jgi:hypothetical protein